MTTTIQTREVDPDLLNAFIGQMVGDLGATVSAGLVLIGDRLGIYRAMADGTPVTAETLAERPRLALAYLPPWRPPRTPPRAPGVARPIPAPWAPNPGLGRLRPPRRRGGTDRYALTPEQAAA